MCRESEELKKKKEEHAGWEPKMGGEGRGYQFARPRYDG